jgi:oxygen-independent coproporphyrinogen-3 oxidase
MAIGLYAHIPFCLRKCNYCDFVSYAYKREDESAYLEALAIEMKLYERLLPSELKEVSSVYLGGGTPTCLSAGGLATLLQNCRRYFKILPGAEISVEANPGTVDAQKLFVLRENGVNRLSIGVQACQQHLLEILGRIHNYAQARNTIVMAKDAGFENINIDLIFDLPGQTLKEWEDCLERVLAFEPVHISAYGLQLEEGTPLYREVHSGKLKPCDEETGLAMYEHVVNALKQAGFIHYEISNFSLPGYQCRHNLRYWRNLSYLGLGPAAHSFLGGCRFSNENILDKYVFRLRKGELPVKEREKLARKTIMAETVFLGLRLTQGLDLDGFAGRFGQKAEEIYSTQIKRLLELDLLEICDGHLRLTAKGLPLANNVFAEFV